MPYTLASATALGFDLVRAPAGAYCAHVIATALAIDDEGLTALAAHYPGTYRERRHTVLTAMHGLNTPSTGFDVIAEAISRDAVDDQAYGTTVQEIDEAAIGTLTHLEQLISGEIFDWTWATSGSTDNEMSLRLEEHAHGVDVVIDAASASFARPILPDKQYDEFVSPFEQISLDSTRQRWFTHHVPHDVRLIIDNIATLHTSDTSYWKHQAQNLMANVASWNAAMTQVAWANKFTGRTRSAAAAQMALVGAVQDAGFSAQDCAHGVWNVFSGAIAAAMVRDVLGDELGDMLLDPWVRRI